MLGLAQGQLKKSENKGWTKGAHSEPNKQGEDKKVTGKCLRDKGASEVVTSLLLLASFSESMPMNPTFSEPQSWL